MSKDTVRVLGEFPCELHSSQLPTKADIIKAIFFEQKSKKIAKEPAINIVVHQINKIWQSAKIPTISLNTVRQQLKNYFGYYYRLSTCDSSRAKNEDHKKVFKVRCNF